ncbi:Dabb family protein [Aliiroseovarius crassostreae]|uniref:Dabb family protein n=1 Tax=Aliiroseovarius crassostreae TaxID=154981 RepID=UPI003C7D098C
MISHVVALALAPDADRATLAQVMQGLADLVGRVEGFLSFTYGPNIDLERKSPDHPYGFVACFANQAALQRYADHPEHQGLGQQLVSLCDGGAEGILVFDIEDGKDVGNENEIR